MQPFWVEHRSWTSQKLVCDEPLQDADGDAIGPDSPQYGFLGVGAPGGGWTAMAQQLNHSISRWDDWRAIGGCHLDCNLKGHHQKNNKQIMPYEMGVEGTSWNFHVFFPEGVYEFR